MKVTVVYSILLKAFLAVLFTYAYVYYKYRVFYVENFIGSLVIVILVLLIVHYLKPKIIDTIFEN